MGLCNLRTDKSRQMPARSAEIALPPCDSRETRVFRTSCCTKTKLYCRRVETHVTIPACNACQADSNGLSTRMLQI
jgi:hypothetical protein